MPDIERAIRRLAHAPAVALALGAAACDRSPARPSPVPSAVHAGPYVAGGAAAFLTADGEFVLPKPPRLARAQITEERAKQLAVAFIRKHGRYTLSRFERIYGAQLDLSALRPAPRAYYAYAPYEQAVPETFHPAVAKRRGPYYLVPLLDGDRPVLTVSVSAYNTDYDIGPNGVLQRPRRAGNDFFPMPASLSAEFAIPVSPERAAQIAYAATGRRVAGVPQLALPDLEYAPHFARWRLRLEAPVRVRGAVTGRELAVAEVFVGPSRELKPELAIPLEAQPSETVAIETSEPTFQERRRRPATSARAVLRRAPSMPVRFEAATVVTPQ